MKTRMIFFVAVGFAIFSCGTNRDSGNDAISGTYVTEYSFKVENPETRDEIGMRTVRDTIFIRRVEKKYEVANHKWMKNDYDLEGWRSMEHSEDRPIPTQEAEYEQSNGVVKLKSELELFIENKRLFKAQKNGNEYYEVE